jgi:hypothetical protein
MRSINRESEALMRSVVLGGVLVSVVVLGGCGSNEAEPEPPLVTITDVESDPPSPSGPESSGPEEPSEDQPLISVSYANGQVTPKPASVKAKLGDKVVIEVTSDVVEEVHVHGYDKFADLEPGKTARVTFTADIPGVSEVELEDAGKLLFNLRVE